MEKRMLALSVSTVYEPNGEILIEGPEYHDMNGDLTRETIKISPDQVDILIQWLKDAKAELEG
jgi:hypothetical protein